MKTKDKTARDRPEDWEPPWLNPANDRKVPYTDEELSQFAEGLMETMGDTAAVQELINRVGGTRAEEIIKERLKAKDQNRLENITINGPRQ